MNYKILDAKWYTPHYPTIFLDDDVCIGIVAIESHNDGSWKCYIGYGMGKDEAADAQKIARSGVPLGSKDAASGFFPQLDESKYRY